MSETVSDDRLRVLLAIDREPLEGPVETSDSWGLGRSVRISKRSPTFSVGFGYALLRWSRFYKRAFSLPELGMDGWVVVFQFFPPGLLPWPKAEYLAGWVPRDRGAAADQWIDFLNGEIAARLATASPSTGHGPLILVGNFREAGYHDQPDAPSLVEERGKRSHEHKADVVRNLRTAPVVSYSPGPVEDALEPGRFVGTFSMRTDGQYVWPEFLAGYVEHHDVRLPPDFEVHMAERHWGPPLDLDVRAVKVPW